MATVLVATPDGALTFVDDANAPTRELDGRRVSSLARHRADVLAVVDGTVLARRDPTGSWSDLATSSVELTCVLPAADGAWCGTADGRLLRLLGDRLVPVPAFDDIEGREAWHAVPSGVPYVRTLTRTADARSTLAGIHVGGIARSGNGGASWRPTVDIEVDVHEIRAHPSDARLVLAAAGYGLAVSRDGGVSWEMQTEGLHATYLRAVAFTTEAAIVSASDGPAGVDSALYRWVDGDPAMTKVQGGLPEWLHGNVDTGNLDAMGELAGFADDGGTTYRSVDGARTWSVLATDLGPVLSVRVLSD